MKNNNKNELIVSNEVFEILRLFFNNNLSNPYLIKSEDDDGRFIKLYIEDSYGEEEIE